MAGISSIHTTVDYEIALSPALPSPQPPLVRFSCWTSSLLSRSSHCTTSWLQVAAQSPALTSIF